MESPDSSVPVVTVGSDLTSRASTALRWAVGEAKRSGARVQVVTVWHPGLASHEVMPPAAERGELMADALTDAGLEPGEASVVMLEGRPGPTLVDAARGSQLLVVGSAGHVGALGAMSGSVSRHCVRHAPCPVAVVGPAAGADPVERVLVSGTLDPEGSTFRWAVTQARRDHADVHLIDSWYLEPIVPSYPELDLRVREEAQDRHAQMLRRLEQISGGSVRVTESLVSGHARDVLQARTRPRDLLVLPYAALHHISFVHGRCPVIVLPPEVPATPAELARTVAAAGTAATPTGGAGSATVPLR